MKKTTTGLFVVRAQPGLHRGHLDALKQGIQQGVDRLVIGVGSSNKEYTSENPFTYEERKKLIEMTSRNLGANLNIEVFQIPDFWNNQQWLSYILENLPHFDCVIAGNPWVTEIMKEAWKTVITPENRELIRGSTLRELLARGEMDTIQEQFPAEVIKYFEQIHAVDRLQTLFKKEKKWPGLTVDVVILDRNGKLILIQRKNAPLGVALPGGFVDVGENLVTAAKREVQEELNLVLGIEKGKDYLWYRDQPERDPRGHTISHVFRGRILEGTPQAWDDAKEVILVDPQDIEKVEFAFPDHKEMIRTALERKG